MGLRTKFNLVMITAFLIGLGVAAFLAREITTEEAKRQMLNEATLIMRSGTAVRSYTQNEIRPLISDQMAVRFLPHSVPSWSAQTVFRQIQKDFPDYSYKEAALNPTNPSDRATNWESDIINVFKRDSTLAEFVATRDTPTGQFLTFSRPFRLTDRACLSCHSTPAAAPATMVDLYGNSNGFGWVLNDVIGAQIVSVPMSVALGRANHSLLAFMAALSLSIAGCGVPAGFHGCAECGVPGDAGAVERADAFLHSAAGAADHRAGARCQCGQNGRCGVRGKRAGRNRVAWTLVQSDAP